MSIERVYHCDGPEQNPDRPGYVHGEPCGAHVHTMTPPPYLPAGFLRVEWGGADGNAEYHFCSWDCVMRYAAAQEPPIFIEVSSPREEDE